MKRIALLVLGLCATASDCGCCCSYYSRQYDFDDGCVQNETYGSRGRARRQRRADRRGGMNRRDGDDGFVGDGCDCCCDSCCGGCANGTAQPMMNSTPTYDSGAMMQGGCATGNCGTMQSYAGTPFDPSAGWTIQSTTSHPVGGEPVMAPPATPATPITPAPAQSSGWAPSSAPSPGPVPPPVGLNR